MTNKEILDKLYISNIIVTHDTEGYRNIHGELYHDQDWAEKIYKIKEKYFNEQEADELRYLETPYNICNEAEKDLEKAYNYYICVIRNLYNSFKKIASVDIDEHEFPVISQSKSLNFTY